jgi:hypothetical protein
MFEALAMAFLKFVMRMVGARGRGYLSLGMSAAELVWVGSWETDRQRYYYR